MAGVGNRKWPCKRTRHLRAMRRNLASLATTPIARADRVGLSRRLTEVNVIQFASSFEVCAGHLVGKLLDLHALLLRRLGSREFPQHPFPQVRCSETCACVGSTMFAAGWGARAYITRQTDRTDPYWTPCDYSLGPKFPRAVANSNGVPGTCILRRSSGGRMPTAAA